MKFERSLFNVLAFLLIWVGVDAAMGQLDSSTWSECLAGVVMAAMFYFDKGENCAKD